MNFTKDHIVLYLKGELPADLRHELEKRMLNDPFLDEAIEGLQKIEDPDMIEAVLAEIEYSLKSRQEEESVWATQDIFRRYRWAFAAAVTLLILTAGIFLLTPFDENMQLVQNEPEVEDTNKLPLLGADSVVGLDSDETNEAARDMKEIPSPESPLPRKSSDGQGETDEIAAFEEAGNEDMGVGAIATDEEEKLVVDEDLVVDVDEDEIVEQTQQDLLVQLDEPEIEEELEIAVAKKQEAKSRTQKLEDAQPSVAPAQETAGLSRRTFGVVDQNNMPVAGANIAINNEGGILSDKSGNFILPEDENSFIIYRSGFKPSGVIDLYASGQTILLERGVSEVAIVTVDNNDNWNVDDLVFNRFPLPENGRQAFLQYVKSNLRFPAEALGNNVSGTVILKFELSELGVLGEIGIEKSLGFGCDEEAIRLLESGPRWRPAIKNGSPVKSIVITDIHFKNN